MDGWSFGAGGEGGVEGSGLYIKDGIKLMKRCICSTIVFKRLTHCKEDNAATTVGPMLSIYR